MRRHKPLLFAVLSGLLVGASLLAIPTAEAASTAPNGYPYCVNGSSSDPDGDGWGWENNASCVVPGSKADGAASGGTASNGYPYCVIGSSSDPDGDGWGWENNATCVVRGSAADPGTGGGGGTGGTSCSVAPVDAAATTAAKRLLCYLYSVYGNHILSGQQESTWVGGPDYEMNYIYNIAKKYPAIRGQDMGDSPDFGSRGLSWWNAGGIPMVGYHMG